MSMCDRCIHSEVCGLEDNHEDAMTFCADMKPKDILNKIRAEIDGTMSDGMIHKATVLGIIDKYKAESEDK